jgi:hypothetical protein
VDVDRKAKASGGGPTTMSSGAGGTSGSEIRFAGGIRSIAPLFLHQTKVFSNESGVTRARLYDYCHLYENAKERVERFDYLLWERFAFSIIIS